MTRELIDFLGETKKRLLRICSQILETRRQNFKFWLSHLKHPKKRLEEMQQHLDDLSSRLAQAIRHGVKDKRNQWERLGVQLDALSPLATLTRGYSIVRRVQSDGNPGKVITQSTQAKAGDDVEITFKRGTLAATISEKK